MDNISHAGPASRLGETLAQTAERQHALLREMTSFAKEESRRFVSLRLERTGAVMDKLQNCQGVTGLIGVQQEWLRDLMRDYAGQTLRFVDAFHGLAQGEMAGMADPVEQADAAEPDADTSYQH